MARKTEGPRVKEVAERANGGLHLAMETVATAGVESRSSFPMEINLMEERHWKGLLPN